MHVTCDGSPESPPLLCIHGSGFSGASWEPMVPVLARRHYVIRVDLPGCGRSPAASYDVPDQADRLKALLDDLDVRQTAVAGHSSGGYVATALAERHRHIVQSLTLISTGPRLDALLPQSLALRVLLNPPFGPVVWRMRSDTRIRAAINATTVRNVDVPRPSYRLPGVSRAGFARRILLAAGRPSAEVAIESGYADQPHLHREVQAYTGMTPRDVATAPWLAIDAVAWPGETYPKSRP